MPNVRARTNQRLRTRKDLLEAALRLSSGGREPSLEEVAEAAMVSRATAYRYFPNVEALLAEASAHVAFPNAEALFAGMEKAGLVDRLKQLDESTSTMIAANEPAIRAMIATSVRQAAAGSAVPVRQNRRSPVIRAALEPFRPQMSPEAFDRLEKALALVIGTEALLVLKDVMRLSDKAATAVRRWAIEALVEKAERA